MTEFYLVSPRTGAIVNCVTTYRSRREIEAMFPDHKIVEHPSSKLLHAYISSQKGTP